MGRPFRDYVENEADRYWREMVDPGTLPKLDRQELRAAAFLIQGKAMRRRQCKVPDPALAPYRAHQGLNAVHMYLVHKGFIKPPYSRIETSPGYLEALLQLQADANWQPRQIPLPAHPDPQHPAIYYYINDPVRNRPVPTEDSLIRGDYVYDPADGSRVILDEYIRPWRGPDCQPSFQDICSRGWGAYYTFSFLGTEPQDRSRVISLNEAAITYHWIESVRSIPVLIRRRDRIMSLTPFGNRVLQGLHFSPSPPSPVDIYRLRRTRDQSIFEMLA